MPSALPRSLTGKTAVNMAVELAKISALSPVAPTS
jgi:hypothetical protein